MNFDIFGVYAASGEHSPTNFYLRFLADVLNRTTHLVDNRAGIFGCPVASPRYMAVRTDKHQLALIKGAISASSESTTRSGMPH